MIRTHCLDYHLSRAEADALNRESGRVYTQTLVWHYRVYRRTGVWLSPGTSERLGDYLSETTLHAHSRDAAQQAFYKACKTASKRKAFERRACKRSNAIALRLNALRFTLETPVATSGIWFTTMGSSHLLRRACRHWRQTWARSTQQPWRTKLGMC